MKKLNRLPEAELTVMRAVWRPGASVFVFLGAADAPGKG